MSPKYGNLIWEYNNAFTNVRCDKLTFNVYIFMKVMILQYFKPYLWLQKA